MRYLIVGYGNLGPKRRKVLGDRCVATVDPVNPEADYKRLEDCPPDSYDAAVLCVPHGPKLALLEQLIRLRKHALIEKPLVFPDEETAHRLAALARENDVIWYTSYNHHFEPQIAEFKKAIDAGKIGRLYSARLTYGNGTVRNLVNTWREAQGGVIEDLGCHLVDLAGWLLGARGSRMKVWERRSVESNGFDRCTMATEDAKIVMEMSFVSWKNRCTIDVYGDKGSAHLEGLCKWSDSELILRERVLPSGVPKETRTVVKKQDDPTWAGDFRHFESLVEKRELDVENDLWIGRVLREVLPPQQQLAEKTTEPAGFVGLSHLGIVSSVGWATFDRPVIGFDFDPERPKALNEGKLPIHEPGLEEAIARHRSQIRFTSDQAELGKCPLVYFALDVPTNENNESDLAVVEKMFLRAVESVRDGVTLVLMSQVRPGFTRQLAGKIRAARPGLKFRLYYQVETLIFGRALERATKPERFIVGCADPDEPMPGALEKGLKRFGCPILPMRYESAELAKTAINLYLCGAVTYANTFSDLCEGIGADWEEIIPSLRLDKRIGPAAYIRPSMGIAGGNLERDIVTVARLGREAGTDVSFVENILQYNQKRYRWALRMLETHVFARQEKPVIAVWGLAYKKDTASIKNSKSLQVLGDIRGRAEIRAFDPMARLNGEEIGGTRVGSKEEALDGADCLLIMTDWDAFREIDSAQLRSRLKQPLVIDAVGLLQDRRRELEGIRYVSMGRHA